MYTEWFLTSSFVTELLVNCLITQFSGRFWAFSHTTCPHRTWSPEHSKTIEPVQKYSIFGHSEAIICGGLQDAFSTWHTSTACLELSDRRKRVVTSAYPVHLCLICFRNGGLQAKLHLGPTFASAHHPGSILSGDLADILVSPAAIAVYPAHHEARAMILLMSNAWTDWGVWSWYFLVSHSLQL